MPQIEVDKSLAGFRVVRWLDESQQAREVPEAIPVDNGPEFLSRAVDWWAYAHGLGLHFIERSQPVQIAFLESLHEIFRNECLNQN